MDAKKTSCLQSTIGNRSDVHTHTGDSTLFLTKNLLPQIQYKNFNRALCLLDPYGLHLDWEVIRLAGQSKAVDMFLNFPVMDMNRNAIWKNSDKAPMDGVERMTKFWGDESWKTAAYTESRQQNMFGPEIVKQGNDEIVAAFKKRLKKVAGFDYVPDPLPMKNSTNAVVYLRIPLIFKILPGALISVHIFVNETTDPFFRFQSATRSTVLRLSQKGLFCWCFSSPQ